VNCFKKEIPKGQCTKTCLSVPQHEITAAEYQRSRYLIFFFLWHEVKVLTGAIWQYKLWCLVSFISSDGQTHYFYYLDVFIYINYDVWYLLFLPSFCLFPEVFVLRLFFKKTVVSSVFSLLISLCFWQVESNYWLGEDAGLGDILCLCLLSNYENLLSSF